jgi:hypothetical protein
LPRVACCDDGIRGDGICEDGIRDDGIRDDAGTQTAVLFARFFAAGEHSGSGGPHR